MEEETREDDAGGRGLVTAAIALQTTPRVARTKAGTAGGKADEAGTEPPLETRETAAVILVMCAAAGRSGMMTATTTGMVTDTMIGNELEALNVVVVVIPYKVDGNGDGRSRDTRARWDRSSIKGAWTWTWDYMRSIWHIDFSRSHSRASCCMRRAGAYCLIYLFFGWRSAYYDFTNGVGARAFREYTRGHEGLRSININIYIYPQIWLYSLTRFLVSLLREDLLCGLDEDLEMLSHVPLFYKRCRGVMPDRVDASNHSTGEEYLALSKDELVRLLRQRILLLQGRGRALSASASASAPALELEHRQGEARARDDLEQVGAALQQAREGLGEADVLPDVGLQAPDAVRAHDEPDLEAAEAPPERDLPVAVVGHEPRVRVAVAQDRQRHAQRVDQRPPVPHVQHAAVEVDQQPLVQVRVEAVEAPQRPLAHQPAVLRAQQRHPRVRRVHVHPDLAAVRTTTAAAAARRRAQLRQHVGDGVHVVDGARVGGAHRGRQEEGLEPPGAQLQDRSPQRRPRHLVPVGGVDRHGPVADAGDLGALLGGAVGGGAAEGDEPAAALGPRVFPPLLVVRGDVGRRLAQVLVARGHDDRRDGLRRRAVDHAAAVGGSCREVALREAEGPRQPVQHDGLELRHRRRADPVERGPRQGRRVHLAQHRRVAARRGEPRCEVGRLPGR